MGAGPRYNLAELAETTGWTVSELENIWLWAGLPAPNSEYRIYTQRELDGLTGLRELTLRESLDWDELRVLLRAINASLERLAIWQVEAMIQHLAKSGELTDTQARIEAASFAPSQGPVLLEHISNLWLRHYAGAVHRLTTEAILRRGVSDDSTFPLMCAVGIARIEEFVERTRDFGVMEYANFVQDFHDRVADIVNTKGGRVVKNMGDLVMYVAPAPAVAADIALDIADLSSANDATSALEVQVAIGWCRVMILQGDAFGPTVNLVSRLSEQTPGGSVYAGPEASAMLASVPRFKLKTQPALSLKGLGLVSPALVQRAGQS